MLDKQNQPIIQGKCIVNSISLKAGEQDFIEKARTIKVSIFLSSRKY